MKKTLLFFGIIAVCSFASCKKDYTCTCTSTVNGTSSGTADITTFNGVSKSAARANCQSTSSTGTYAGTAYTQVTTCKLN
jgi:hypothetical protein